MTPGSSMQAITRSLPPHLGQVSMSIANTRFRRCIQVMGARGLSSFGRSGSRLGTMCSEAEGQYSWWRQFGGARENNVGWRIDYVFASPSARRLVRNAFIWPQVLGSDHAPVGVDLD